MRSLAGSTQVTFRRKSLERLGGTRRRRVSLELLKGSLEPAVPLNKPVTIGSVHTTTGIILARYVFPFNAVPSAADFAYEPLKSEKSRAVFMRPGSGEEHHRDVRARASGGGGSRSPSPPPASGTAGSPTFHSGSGTAGGFQRQGVYPIASMSSSASASDPSGDGGVASGSDPHGVGSESHAPPPAPLSAAQKWKHEALQQLLRPLHVSPKEVSVVQTDFVSWLPPVCLAAFTEPHRRQVEALLKSLVSTRLLGLVAHYSYWVLLKEGGDGTPFPSKDRFRIQGGVLQTWNALEMEMHTFRRQSSLVLAVVLLGIRVGTEVGRVVWCACTCRCARVTRQPLSAFSAVSAGACVCVCVCACGSDGSVTYACRGVTPCFCLAGNSASGVPAVV